MKLRPTTKSLDTHIKICWLLFRLFQLLRIFHSQKKKKKKKNKTKLRSIQYSLLARAVKRHKRSLPPLIMQRNFLKNRTFLGVGKDGRFVCLSKTHLYGQISWQCD